MSGEENLSRKKRIRGGHRGSAKRTITELYEAIESTDGVEAVITKLRQCKLALEEKLETVRHIDGQILELVTDEELEDEIEQSDIFRERLQRAIIDATNTIDMKGNPSTHSAPEDVTSASVPLSVVPDSMVTVAATSTSGSISMGAEGVVTVTTTSTGSDITATVSTTDSLVTTGTLFSTPIVLPSVPSAPVTITSTTARSPVVSMIYSGTVGLPRIELPVIPSCSKHESPGQFVRCES